MDNKNFILILRKDDVIDLFKFGRWSAQCPSEKFDGNIDKLSQNNKLMKKLFNKANPFSYSIEYFLIHILCPRCSSFEIDDVVGIYPLDQESYKIGISLSPEVKLQKPVFEKYYQDFQVAIEVADAKKGIDNVFSIFGLIPIRPLLKKGELEQIIRDSIFEHPIQGEHSLWYYLLRYERHQSYPKDTRGFLIDSIHAFHNYIYKKDIDDSLIKSHIGNYIMSQSPKIKYIDLLECIKSDKVFLKKCEKEQKGFYKVAPLFLILKDAFSAGIHEDNLYCGMPLTDFVNATNKYGKDVLQKALYLLGIALGRENTYQYMYKKNKLPILK